MTTEPEQAQPVAPFYRRVSEIIRDPSEWANFPQVDVATLEGSTIVVHDVMFLRGNIGQRDDMDYAILIFGGPDDAPEVQTPNGVQVPRNARTTMCGGSVFVRKLKQLAGHGPANASDGNMLPVAGRIARRQGKNFPTPYFDFV